jgi:hypothetical protein
LAEGIGLAVNSWKLAGPFPEAPASTPYTGTEPLVRAVGKQLQTSKRPFVLTESMQCFAREMGRFFTVHRKFPQLDLQALAGRCGVVPNSPSVFYVTSAGQPSIDAAVKIIDKDLQGVTGAQELGVWMGGSDKGQVVMAVYDHGHRRMAPHLRRSAGRAGRRGRDVQGRLLRR